MTWRDACCAFAGLIRLAQNGTSSAELHVTGLQGSDIEWTFSGVTGCKEGSDATELADASAILQSTGKSRPAQASRKLRLLQEAAADLASSSSNKALAQQTLSCTLTWDESPRASMHHVFYCCVPAAARASLAEDWAPWTWLGSSRQQAFRVASLELQCATEVAFAVSASDISCNWNVEDAAVVTVRPEDISLQ